VSVVGRSIRRWDGVAMSVLIAILPKDGEEKGRHLCVDGYDVFRSSGHEINEGSARL
jgi:hypothetical protein